MILFTPLRNYPAKLVFVFFEFEGFLALKGKRVLQCHYFVHVLLPFNRQPLRCFTVMLIASVVHARLKGRDLLEEAATAARSQRCAHLEEANAAASRQAPPADLVRPSALRRPVHRDGHTRVQRAREEPRESVRCRAHSSAPWRCSLAGIYR